MADVPELHLVPHRCGIWFNSVGGIDRKDHDEACRVDEHLAYKMEKKAYLKKRSAEETKLIPAIYDKEVSAASADPSTSGQFSTPKSGEDFFIVAECIETYTGICDEF
ncbi:conserved hypothetical protein [Trichinella spiralis]|uniref:hypothetical protein n=1 Tax=Trichinella spiralis TaxID=6334 RepID=UPI0001EFC77C|nr:conserved hypothetical protein [Trichinella spiralis]